MENQPILSQNRTYGLNNPGYVPAAEGEPPMCVPPDSDGVSAPPATFDSVPGYEGMVAGGGGFLPPPPAYPVPQPTPAPEQPHWNIPSITEDIARDAFIQFASSKCCYSSGPAKDGVITNMEAFNTYRYRLETFTETRSTDWAQEPYRSQPVDAGTQPPPRPWDIPAKTPRFFVASQKIIRVPYTTSKKTCHVCLGRARWPCNGCNGLGGKMCWACNGSGFGGNSVCSSCNGRGRHHCLNCHGQRFMQCGTCRGRGQLLVYLNVTVKWTNNSDDYVVEQSSGLQVDKLSKVSGMELYKDSQYMVYPVIGFPDHQVMQAAQRLVNEHQVKFCQTSRILQQRQTIELIPITRVTYTWKGNSHIYYVYGNEYAVNADGYPATCCCTVM